MSTAADVQAVLERVGRLLGVGADSDIARGLGASPQTLSTWKRRGTIPYERLIRFAAEHDVSLDYLLLNRKARPDPIDWDLVERITQALKDPEGFPRLSLGGAQVLLDIYNQAVATDDAEAQEQIIRGAIRMLKMAILRGQRDQMREFAEENPEAAPSETDEAIASMDRELEQLEREKDSYRVTQQVSGKKHQIAGRDVVNKGKHREEE
ncbi:helix-turn-helix domain-containing protein [Aquisalimonas asiatica]|uniref:Bacteriophage CI repressor helix-turn-helix domain-containing protein n=1 Tax=Aquisalimonas asiatica TaxID=406100 RepID=A0A1H8RSN7_9GAMM|nr:helix-turn-helix domain-containing protein [Aquisalimonas asiatica]SEO69481.1 Bacteriophage CI repressor helix-turn-helix domain-containing protein [Aquisalimonas asiatica]